MRQTWSKTILIKASEALEGKKATIAEIIFLQSEQSSPGQKPMLVQVSLESSPAIMLWIISSSYSSTRSSHYKKKFEFIIFF